MESIGSGFFIDNKGNLLTNYHVIRDAIKVFIQLPKYGAQTYLAEVKSVYPKLDLALLKTDQYKNTAFLELGDSSEIVKGDELLAVGYPLGQEKIKVTSGVFSGYQDGDIQTDSAINPGNSGGPLLKNNKVIGINYAGYDDAQNVGYAIPIDYIKLNLPTMFENSFIEYPVLGAIFNNSSEIMMKVSAICKEGYYIAKVIPGGTFDKVGVKVGDILCNFDGLKVDNYGEVFIKELNSKFHISDYMNFKKAGDIFKIQVARVQGDTKKMMDLEIILDSSSLYAIRSIYPAYDNIEYQIIGGLVIMELTNNHLSHKDFKNHKNLLEYQQLDNKTKPVLIVTSVLKGSKIAENEIISAPFILKEVNGEKVGTLADLRRVLFLYFRNNGLNYFTFLTNQDKYFMLEYYETREQENFLSDKYNYEINEFTSKLLSLGKYEGNNFIPTQQKSSPSPSLEVTNNNLRTTIFDVLETSNNKNSVLAPLAPNDSSFTPVMFLAPIDSSSTPAPSTSVMSAPVESNLFAPVESNLLAPVESNLLAPVESNLLAPVESNEVSNVFPAPSAKLNMNENISHNTQNENKKMVEKAMVEMNQEKKNLNKKKFGVVYNNLSEASNLLRNSSLDPF